MVRFKNRNRKKEGKAKEKVEVAQKMDFFYPCDSLGENYVLTHCVKVTHNVSFEFSNFLPILTNFYPLKM